MRRVKIVATIGPATSNEQALSGIIEAGVDVIRINGAHGDIKTLANRVETIRTTAAKLGKLVGILVDLPGPKMRVGVIKDEEIKLEENDRLKIVNEPVIGTKEQISTTVQDLYSIVEKDDPIILADGQIRAVIEKVEGKEVLLKILTSGTLKSKKGFFLPHAEDKITPFSDTDHEIIKASIKAGVDFLGLSFVRRGSDVDEIRALLPKKNHTHLIAKIETRSAVDELPSILSSSDAIMVARGDLGIQLDITRVPLLQKEIIRACNQAGRPVITATEMLESMTTQPIPTRAEVGDVANAVLDGTDAVMLSGETAVGRFPIETVSTMSQVAQQAEAWRKRRVPDVCVLGEDPVAWAVAHAVVQAAQDLNVTAILCPTRSGATAQRIAAYRPSATIVGISQNQNVLAQLSLIWGVQPVLMEDEINIENEVNQIVELSVKYGYIKKGDLVAVASGTPGRKVGGTDSIRIVHA
ncbi:MAG: pyruvate kinase [Acidimicrobiia bacterium]